MATPVYEKTNLANAFCHVDTVQLNEFNNTGYTYSGLTLVLELSNFTPHFDTTGHTYNNVILNNDVYIYTGITGETHFFTIYDFYSGGTPSIDPKLTGMTESNVISGFTKDIIFCTDLLAGLTGTCCPTEAVKSNLPWVYQIDHGGGANNCDPIIARRPVSGWTLNYVFNRKGLPWADEVFFYEGVRDEYDMMSYADNNLSFMFTSDGRIRFESIRYTGYCDTLTGWTNSSYIYSGQTFPLCPNGTSGDFNITIVFERYYPYTGCDLPNEGGWNDLIHTGETSTSGSTIVQDIRAENLSSLWLKERNKRLGTLKIYLNGRPQEIEVPLSVIRNFRNLPVYHFKDFEEIILSDRGFQPFTHAVGGGVTGSGNIHNSVCCYSIKYASYYEDPMQALEVRDQYKTITKPAYNITECWDPCEDILIGEFVTPTITPTPSITPSITPSVTPSITPPSVTLTPTPTPTPIPTIVIFTGTSQGGGSNLATLNMQVYGTPTITIDGTGRFYDDINGTLNERTGVTFTSGWNTIYVKIPSGTSLLTIIGGNQILRWGYNDYYNNGANALDGWYGFGASSPSLDITNIKQLTNIIDSNFHGWVTWTLTISDLPRSLQFCNMIDYYYGMEIPGDISNLPPNIIYINFYNGTLTGALSGLPYTLESIYIDSYIINNITGSVASIPGPIKVLLLNTAPYITGTLSQLPSTIVSLLIGYDWGISGTVNQLPSNLKRLYIENTSASNISGAVTDLPSGLISLVLNNTGVGINITGDTMNLPLTIQYLRLINDTLTVTKIDKFSQYPDLYYIVINSACSGVTYQSPSIWNSNLDTFFFQPIGTGLTTNEVDNIFIDINTYTSTAPLNGFDNIVIDGANAAPSALSASARASLTTKGYTVVTN